MPWGRRKGTFSSDSFLCNVDPSSGPVADMFIPFLLLQTFSVGAGLAEQLLAGWGSEWKHTSSVRSFMSSCVPLHTRCPAQSPQVPLTHSDSLLWYRKYLPSKLHCAFSSLHFYTYNPKSSFCGCFKFFRVIVITLKSIKVKQGIQEMVTNHIKTCFTCELFGRWQDWYLVISHLLFHKVNIKMAPRKAGTATRSWSGLRLSVFILLWLLHVCIVSNLTELALESNPSDHARANTIFLNKSQTDSKSWAHLRWSSYSVRAHLLKRLHFIFTVRDKRKSNHTNHVSCVKVPLWAYL